MFYCENCRVKNKWPTSPSTSYGPCEICGRPGECHDEASRALPPRPRAPLVSSVALVTDILKEMTPEDRKRVLHEFCVHCGGDDGHNCLCTADD